MIYRFGACELDETAGELRRDGQVVAIQPKPLALLRVLIGERHRIVATDELLDRLWPDEAVTPNSLTRAVSVARVAIGDSGRSGMLRSYTRRGYRFHGDVVEIEPAVPGAAGEASSTVAPEAMPFVGRSEVLAELRALWDGTCRGRPGLAVVAGPAGVGKTRLTEALEAEVDGRGGLVLRGRALEAEGEPAFWVWAQMLRALHGVDPDALAVPGLADTGELLPLMPELRVEEPGPAASLPEEQRRFVFFDAVAQALRGAATRRPLLVLFEDLHWADAASLRLLEHLAFELEGASVMVVATVRDPANLPDDPSVRTRAVLARNQRLVNLVLSRLAPGEVEELVERLLGRPRPDLARTLHRRTDGLPLFLREACRGLGEGGAADAALAGDLALPRVDWVKEALAGLGEACGKLLGAASAVGREFSLPHAAAAAEIARDEALDLLDDAVRAGVLEAPPESPTRYAFVHDLFREAAYETLAPSARARTHLRIAHHLEKQHAGDEDRVIAELALHHHRALAVGDPERALACASAAAGRAFEAHAYEQAAVHGRQALAALDHAEGAPPDQRLAILLELGEAARLASERRARRRYLGEALDLARRLDRPQDFAIAAIGLCDLAEWGARDDIGRAAVVEALERLVDAPPELEARLLTRLGYLDAVLDRESSEKVLRRAAELTRELGESDALEEVLYALHLVLGGPDGLDERLAILDELRGTAAAARDPVASVTAVLDVAGDRLQLGELDDALALRREADTMAGTPPHPRTIWNRRVFDTGLALLEGRLDEVEGRIEEAFALGRRIEHPYAQGCLNAHRTHLHAQRVEREALVESLEPALAASQGPTHWVRARMSQALHALGDRARAERVYEEALADGLLAIPRNLRWVVTLTELAHSAADLGDAERAPEFIETLGPLAHHHAILPMVVCYGGPVAWALGRLYAVLGDTEEALDHHEAALVAVGRLGAKPAEAHLRIGYAKLLREHGKAREAREHLIRAAALASDLGAPELERVATESAG